MKHHSYYYFLYVHLTLLFRLSSSSLYCDVASMLGLGPINSIEKSISFVINMNERETKRMASKMIS